MKKTILSFAVLAAVGLASCQPSAQNAEDEGAAIKAKIENCSDLDSLKIYVQQARDYAAKLENEGDDSAAKSYLDGIIPTVREKDATALSAFEGLKNVAEDVIDAAKVETKAIGDDAKNAAENAVNGAVEAGKDKVEDAVNDAKGAANSAVQAGKDKADEAANKAKKAADDAKKKAGDAVQKGADKLKDALNGK